jgi:hypothetical protein
MRVVANDHGVDVKAYAGVTGVLLAMNLNEKACEGLLGFAIERTAPSYSPGKQHKWLAGMMPFPGQKHAPGALIDSNVAPIQKFRWSDYTVFPGTLYQYTIHPVYGTPTTLDVRPGPSVEVTTGSLEKGDVRVIFNRAVTASQAFSREFPALDKKIRAAQAKRAKTKTKKKTPPAPLTPEAYKWLSRGLLEQITGFLARAIDKRWAVDICIYEYELEAIAMPSNKHKRGAPMFEWYITPSLAIPAQRRTLSILLPWARKILDPALLAKSAMTSLSY